MSGEIALSAQGLSKRFNLHTERRFTLKERLVRGGHRGSKEFWALRDVDFEVRKGSFFGIIGHNGSGKSTALKVMAGIYRPTSGRIRVNGRLRALLELGAGFNPELTGRENIQLNASILGLTQREIRRSMDQIIDFAGIDDFIDSPVKVYSSGMSVRLGFAVAVHLDPEILIVDEIIAVGDEEFQRQCQDFMTDLRRAGRTIVLVTHSMSAVEQMCDEAVWLDHGRVRASGDSTEVVRDYLGDVNRSEAAKKSGLAAEAQDGNRRGSGEIQVTSVEALDIDGQPIPVVTTGAYCRFRLHYTSDVSVDTAEFGLGIHADAGVCISLLETRNSGSPQSVGAGEGYVDVVVDPLPLKPGNYLLSTWAALDKATLVDFVDRGTTLKVRSSSNEGLGLVRIPAAWDWAKPSQQDFGKTAASMPK